MDKRDFILTYLKDKYYQPNLSAEVARNLNMQENELIDNIHLINRENNGLILLKESIGKNKYVLSLRPNSEQEINDFINNGGFTNKRFTPEQETPKLTRERPSVKIIRQNSGKWIAIIALLFALAALTLSIYNYLQLGGYL